MPKVIYPDESYAIMGACFEVHNEKGCGFTEPVFQECLEMELEHRRIPFTSQPEMKLGYRGRILSNTFRPDFICYEKIILEIKAVADIVDEYRAQVLNYLNASHFQLGLLINFGTHPKLQVERIPFTSKRTINESHQSSDRD